MNLTLTEKTNYVILNVTPHNIMFMLNPEMSNTRSSGATVNITLEKKITFWTIFVKNWEKLSNSLNFASNLGHREMIIDRKLGAPDLIEILK